MYIEIRTQAGNDNRYSYFIYHVNQFVFIQSINTTWYKIETGFFCDVLEVDKNYYIDLIKIQSVVMRILKVMRKCDTPICWAILTIIIVHRSSHQILFKSILFKFCFITTSKAPTHNPILIGLPTFTDIILALPMSESIKVKSVRGVLMLLMYSYFLLAMNILSFLLKQN